MNKIIYSINAFFEKAEKRFGNVAVSLVLGIIFLFLAMVVSACRFETYHHGNSFTRLSLSPFGADHNDLRLRILSPLLGYLFFFRGHAFIYFMLIILAVFIGYVYLFNRKNNMQPVEAIGITLLLALSTLTFYQLFFPAYTDPTSFLLIILFISFRERRGIAAICLSLMLFNHENSFFLFPFFFLLLLDKNFKVNNIARIILLFAAAIAPYLLFRFIITSRENIDYTTSFYFDASNLKWTREHVIPNLAGGIFQAFRLTWILPLMAILINVYEKRFWEILLITTCFLFVCCQLYLAHDISRLTGFSFPAILIAAFRLKDFLGSKKFVWLVYSVVILNFLVPSYYIGALDPISLAPAWWPK